VPDAGHQRLADAMDERRLELGLRWTDVTARGGPSGEWIRSLRRGDVGEIRGLTRARIAKALGWPRSYVDELLGEEPGDDRPPAVAANWDDENVRALWGLTVGEPQRTALVEAYLAERKPERGGQQASTR
jgi:hypothetical protein